MTSESIEKLGEFRAEVCDWLKAHCPDSMRTPMPDSEIVWGGTHEQFKNPDSRAWLDAMASRGWTAPEWPAAYCGGGLTKAQNRVLQDELLRIRARPALYSFGLWMFGPALIEFGNEEQKRRFLPDIVKGRIRWCQGYSEPGAGSDLASLKTTCEDKGDRYLINGQKVWTSYADQADWIFCLVRTDSTVKQAGISFIVFDMNSPGVAVRPIRLISGASPFCETFFTNVAVPKDQLVGEINAGWEIAKRLLQHERSSISATGFGGAGLPGPEECAKQHIGLDAQGRLVDADLRSRLADHLMFAEAFDLTVRRTTEQSKMGQDAGHTGSILKYAVAKTNQDRYELSIEALGSQGLGWDGPGFDDYGKRSLRAMLRSKGNSIEGGTSEINLNVIAKRVLGL